MLFQLQNEIKSRSREQQQFQLILDAEHPPAQSSAKQSRRIMRCVNSHNDRSFNRKIWFLFASFISPFCSDVIKMSDTLKVRFSGVRCSLKHFFLPLSFAAFIYYEPWSVKSFIKIWCQVELYDLLL